jgi:hypothetical protein
MIERIAKQVRERETTEQRTNPFRQGTCALAGVADKSVI